MYAGRPPREATPAMVLAAEPPDVSCAGAMALYKVCASASSIRRIAPLIRLYRARNSSPVRATTSTMALPTPTTSSSPLLISRDQPHKRGPRSRGAALPPVKSGLGPRTAAEVLLSRRLFRQQLFFQ